MPVNTTERSEEVTKHSVHTLVFRSQKRTHDMFISDQGALPSLDQKAADLSRRVKARATYGPIMAAVEQNKKRMKAAGLEQINTLALTQEGATSDKNAGETGEDTSGPNSELSLYQPQGNPGGIGITGASTLGSANSQVGILFDTPGIFGAYPTTRKSQYPQFWL